MVWKKVDKEAEKRYLTKRATESRGFLFSHAHTREVSEVNQSSNCKKTVEKKLTRDQELAYNQMLEWERLDNEPKSE